MGIFSKIFKSKRDKLVEKIDKEKANSKHGIDLALLCIERANVLGRRMVNLRTEAEAKHAYHRKKIADNPRMAKKYPTYTKMVNDYIAVRDACYPVIEATRGILVGLKEEKANLENSQRILTDTEKNLKALDATNETKKQEYQKAIDEADAIIKENEGKIKEYNDTIKGFEETIKKGEEAATELETVRNRITEIETELKKISTDLSDEAEEKRKQLNEEKADKKSKRGELEELKDKGTETETEKAKYIKANSKAIKQAQRVLDKKLAHKKDLEDTEAARATTVKDNKAKLGDIKTAAERDIQESLKQVAALKKALDEQEAEASGKEVEGKYNEAARTEQGKGPDGKIFKEEERLKQDVETQKGGFDI